MGERGAPRPAGDPRWKARFRTGAIAAAVGAAAFAVYWRTLAASIVWGDNPELIAAAYHAGVPHPTGYPLYMLLGHAFTRLLDFGSVAYRMNLLSALFAAAAVGLVFLVMRRVTRSLAISLAGTLLFAFSRTFWSQAVIAEVYALHLLFAAGVLASALAWDARGDRRLLLAAAFLYGLSFTHHLTSVLLAPGLLYLAITSPHRRQFLAELRWSVPLFLLPVLVYAYLPMAAFRDPPLNWGDPRSWDALVYHATGREYRHLMFRSPLHHLWPYFTDYAWKTADGGTGMLPAQFGASLLLPAPLGLAWLFRRRRRLFGLTLLVYLAVLFYALNYRIYDIEVYYLPAHLMTAIWIACGLRQLATWLVLLWKQVAMTPERRRPLKAACGGALLLLPVSVLSANWEASDRSGDFSTLAYARAVLDGLKPNAVLLAAGDNEYFPVLYTRFVENRRPDVTVVRLTNFQYPARLRLVTRLEQAGLRIRVPDDYRRLRSMAARRQSLLRRLIADNLPRRPLYFLGPQRFIRSHEEQVGPGAACTYSPDSTLPLAEITPRARRPEPEAAQPRRARRVAPGERAGG